MANGAATAIDVLACFRLLFQRDPTPEEYSSYQQKLWQGLSAHDLVKSFLTHYDFLKSSTASAIFGYAHEYRSGINNYVIERTGSIVQSGPFAGMKMKPASARGDGDISPKLLGTYESEIQAALRSLSTQSYEKILDVGCAEGYYTIGCALLFNSTTVIGYDNDAQALKIARDLALYNNVSDRVLLEGNCDAWILMNECNNCRNLVISDCEGYEKILFGSEDVARALKKSDLIIETHDILDPSVTPTILPILQKTHHVEIVSSGARDPNAFPFLRSRPEIERWLAVCERRSASMDWLICRAR